MNFSSRSFTSAFLVIVVAVFGYFVLMPRWNSYTLAKSLLEEQQEKQKSLEKAQGQLNAFLDEFHQHSREAGTLNTSLPLNRDELYNILNSLDQITKESGIILSGFNIFDTPETDTLGAQRFAVHPVDIQISGSGTYFSFKQFLSRLEANLRIIDVKSITLNKDEGDLFTYNIKFRTYYQK